MSQVEPLQPQQQLQLQQLLQVDGEETYLNLQVILSKSNQLLQRKSSTPNKWLNQLLNK